VKESVDVHFQWYVYTIVICAWVSLVLTWVSATMVQQTTSALVFATGPKFGASKDGSFRLGNLAMAFHWTLAALVTLFAVVVPQNLVDLLATDDTDSVAYKSDYSTKRRRRQSQLRFL
jgi:hypothetical protein